MRTASILSHAGRVSARAMDGILTARCSAASLRPLDGEALDVVLGLGRIEGLAHDQKVFVVAVGGVSPTSFISLAVSVARNTCLATPA